MRRIGLALVLLALVGTLSTVAVARWRDNLSTDSLHQAAGDHESAVRTVELDYGFFLDQASARSLAGIVSNSDLIVVGTVLDEALVSRPKEVSVPFECWTPTPENAGKECSGRISGQDGYYLSDYRIKVERVLKGSPLDEVTVQELGGLDGTTRYVVPGIPTYRVGQRYLVFVKNDTQKPGVRYTSAANLGAFPIEGGQVERLPTAKAYAGGAPAALDALSELEAVAVLEREVALGVSR